MNTNIIFNRHDWEFYVDRYALEFEYDTDRDCDAAGCDSICRCSKISNARIDPDCELTHDIVKIYKIRKKGYREEYKPSVIERYCIDRIFRAHKLYDRYSYEVEICGGYYGQEIAGVSHDSFYKFYEDLLLMLEAQYDIEKIKIALNVEYSYILPELALTHQVEIVVLSLENIMGFGSAGSKFHRMKRGDNFYMDEDCRDITQPLGVVFNDRLIDGHHRTVAAHQKGFITAKYIKVS